MLQYTPPRAARSGGFTLIEMMVVVVILGVLAAIALPAFGGYLKQTKTSEATTNINNVFKSAAAFYHREHTDQGMSGNSQTACIVETTDVQPPNPTHQKRKFTQVGGYQTLAFNIADLVYYSYGISSVATSAMTCGTAPESNEVYTFYALGDIDGDSVLSTFSLAVGTNEANQLYHSRGYYIFQPNE